jgi:hypothetical protein
MAASGSEMEVVLVAQVAPYIKAMQDSAAANQAVLKSLTEMTGGLKQIPGASKPAEAAIGGLEQTFKNFKRDQVQEGRMVGFYVREMTAFTGASPGVQSALGGITQGMLGFATASGPLLMIWAGFEIFKGLASWFTEIGDAASKAAEDAAKAVEKLGDQLAALANKRLGIGPGDVSQGQADAARRLVSARDAARAQFEASGGGTILGGGDATELNTINAQIAAWEKINGKLETFIALKTQIAAEQGGVLGPGNAEAGKTFFDEQDKARAERLKLVYENLGNEMQRLADEEDRAVTGQIARLTALKTEMEAERLQRIKYSMAGTQEQLAGTEEEGRGLDFKGQGVVANDAMKTLNEQARQSVDIFSALGGAIGSAFGSIGEMIGGAAGAVMKVLGQMIQQAVQLAISLAMASMAWTSPLGMIAIGSIALAGILGLMAAVPSFEVGTSYVPRTGLAMIHQGERIIPASQNRPGAGSSITVNVSTPDAQSFERMLRRNDNALVRVLREATASGRY